MSTTFRATIHSYRTDAEGEATLAVKIPFTDRDQGSEVGKLTQKVLIVTVFEEHEVGETVR